MDGAHNQQPALRSVLISWLKSLVCYILSRVMSCDVWIKWFSLEVLTVKDAACDVESNEPHRDPAAGASSVNKPVFAESGTEAKRASLRFLCCPVFFSLRSLIPRQTSHSVPSVQVQSCVFLRALQTEFFLTGVTPDKMKPSQTSSWNTSLQKHNVRDESECSSGREREIYCSFTGSLCVPPPQSTHS